MIFAEVPNQLSMCFKQLTFHLILNHITTHHLPCINLVYKLGSNERVELLKAINRWISTSARTNSSKIANNSFNYQNGLQNERLRVFIKLV